MDTIKLSMALALSKNLPSVSVTTLATWVLSFCFISVTIAPTAGVLSTLLCTWPFIITCCAPAVMVIQIISKMLKNICFISTV